MIEEIKEILKDKSLMAVLSVIFLAAVGACSSCLWKPDNPLEEAVEEAIFEETGIDIEFTPDREGTFLNIVPFKDEEEFSLEAKVGYRF